MSLLPDFKWKLKYTPEDGNLVQLFYVPVLKCANRYDRSTGFFSATALTLAARGIEGLVRNDGHMRLIVGCTLHEEEVEAIRKGEELRATVEAHLGNMPLQADNSDEKDALELLAWMVAKGILDVRVAVPCDQKRQPIASNGIFHEKAGIVEDKAGHRLAWNGSLNETVYGWQENWESINVFQSWEQDARRVDEEEQNFARIWAGISPRLLTLDVPSAIEQNLLRFLPDNDMPARLEKADAIDRPINPSASPDGDGLDLVEQRRLLWGYIKYAPSFDRPGAERVVIQVVASLPHLINEVPRPYSLHFLAEFGGIGQKKIYSSLCRLDLLGVLSENPNQAIQKATALLPLALLDHNLIGASSTFTLERSLELPGTISELSFSDRNVALSGKAV